MSRNVIRDGYTKTAVVKPVPGIHDGISLRYRPMLPHQVDAVTYSVEEKRRARQYEAANLLYGSAIAKHLLEWSEVDQEGKPLPRSAQNIASLPPPLFRQVFNIVSGYEAGDLPEQASEDEQDQYLRDLEAEALTGLPPGPAGLEADQKNSAAA